MTHFEVKVYSNSSFEQWNEFLVNSKNGTFLFHRNFMEYHKDRFEDASLMVYNNNKLVAIFPANKVSDTIYSHQGLTYGGIVVKKDCRMEIVKEVFDAIVFFYREEKMLKLVYKEIPSIYCCKYNDDFKYLLWNNGAKLFRVDTLNVVDLKFPILLRGGRKDGVKRGKKNNLVIREVDSFDEFWDRILIPNLSDKHGAKPVHTLSEITYLKSKFPEKIRQFNVYMNDEIVAGTTIFETREVAHSQYISANKDKNILGSLDLLHYYLLNDVFNDKPYFDFGISNEEQGEKINAGLNFWKQSFGASTYAQLFFELDLQAIIAPKPIFI